MGTNMDEQIIENKRFYSQDSPLTCIISWGKYNDKFRNRFAHEVMLFQVLSSCILPWNFDALTVIQQTVNIIQLFLSRSVHKNESAYVYIPEGVKGLIR
jgi:hypothetical protein